MLASETGVLRKILLGTLQIASNRQQALLTTITARSGFESQIANPREASRFGDVASSVVGLKCAIT